MPKVATTQKATYYTKAERQARRNLAILEVAKVQAARCDVTPTDKAGWKTEYASIVSAVNARAGRTGQANAYVAVPSELRAKVQALYAPTVSAPTSAPAPTSNMHEARKAYVAFRKAHRMRPNTKLNAAQKSEAIADLRSTRKPAPAPIAFDDATLDALLTALQGRALARKNAK